MTFTDEDGKAANALREKSWRQLSPEGKILLHLLKELIDAGQFPSLLASGTQAALKSTNTNSSKKNNTKKELSTKKSKYSYTKKEKAIHRDIQELADSLLAKEQLVKTVTSTFEDSDVPF